MKIIQILTIVLLFTGFQLNAQDEPKNENKSKGKSINITFGEDDEEDSDHDHDHDHDYDHDHDEDDYKRKRAKMRFGMMDLGISTYLTEDNEINMPEELSYLDQRLGKSINVGIHFIDLKLGLSGRKRPQYLGISTGLRMNMVHYSFENDFELAQNQETFEAAIVDASKDISKHRIFGNYMMVPAMLEINTNPANPSKSFNIAFGYVHNFLLWSNHKIKFDDSEKIKVKDDFNLNKSYGMVEGRIGYGALNFYVQYGLDGLFQANAGPNVTPINFGVNIIPR